MSLRHGSFLSARDENMPVQAVFQWWPLALGQPNHYYLRHLYTLMCVCDVCDVCVYEYASTNSKISDERNMHGMI